MIELEETRNGIVLPVQGQPRSKKNAINGAHAGALKVAVTQVPEKGKATDAIREVLVKQLGLKNSQVSLQSGETTTQKKFLITGISLADLRTKLVELLQHGN